MKIKPLIIIFCLAFLCLSFGSVKNFATNPTTEATTSFVDGFCFLSVQESPPETNGGVTCSGFTATRYGCTDGTADCTVQAIICQSGNQIQVNLASSCGW